MSTTGLLAQYMALKSQLSEYQLLSTKYNNLQTANTSKLNEQTKAEEKWDSAYSKAEEKYNDPSQELKLDGTKVLSKSSDESKNNINERAASGWRISDRAQFAEKFASASVPKFQPDALEDYANLDMEYGTMVAYYDTMCEELQAQMDAIKPQLEKDSQDSHMIGG